MKESGMKLDDFGTSIRPFYTTHESLGVHFLRRQFTLDDNYCWDIDYVYNRLILLEDTSETEIFTMSRILNYMLGGSGVSAITDQLYELESLCEQKAFHEDRKNVYFKEHQDEIREDNYINNIASLHKFMGHQQFSLWSYKSKQTKVVVYMRPSIGFSKVI